MTLEEYNLKSSWDCYPSEYLDHYLVSGVEDPRMNVQSILTRALLVDALHPGRFDALITEELRFGVVLTWILRQLEKRTGRYELLDAIESPCPAQIPEFIVKTYAWLQDKACPIPDYIAGALSHEDYSMPSRCLSDLMLDTFMTIWREQFPQPSGNTISVLEVACGSANDYRFLHRCGIAQSLKYTGIDIAARNVVNAKRRYPKVDFLVRSILTTDFPDSSFDYLYCHDLIEHLSLAAMERALGQMLRIARNEVVLHFFNAKWDGDHETVPVGAHHRNRVSMERIRAFLERLGARATCLEVAQWCREKFGFPAYHNPNAFSMIVEKRLELAT